MHFGKKLTNMNKEGAFSANKDLSNILAKKLL